LNRIIGILLTISLLFSCNKENKTSNPLAIKYQEKGVSYQMENKTDSAIFYYKKAIKLEPNEIASIESLVKIYWLNEQPQLALKAINELPNKIQERSPILVLEGMTLEKMNRLNDAMELYKQAYNLIPEIKYENEKNIIEFIGYLTLQTVIGKKEKTLNEFKNLKEKKLTETERQYVNFIEPIIKKHKGGGYNKIVENE
jgi:tetratricopeptide (TPR) repeat protein